MFLNFVIFLFLYGSAISDQEEEDMYQFFVISGDIMVIVPRPFSIDFIKTKHGDRCNGLAIFPKVTVTTCSCAIAMGADLGTNKFDNIESEKIWFQVYEPTGFGSEKMSKRYQYISVMAHKKCKDKKHYYIYDIAIGIMDNEINVLYLYKQHYKPKPIHPKQAKICQVFYKYNPGYSNYLIGTNITVKPFNKNCTFSLNDDETYIDGDSHYCVTDTNCNYDVGTALKCGNNLVALMSSQFCVSKLNVLAVKLTLAYNLSDSLTPEQKGLKKSKGTRHTTITPFMVALFYILVS